MAKPLSDDLRCRILQAFERKEGSRRQLALRFGVSFEYVRKIRRQQRRSGCMGRVAQSRHGQLSRFTAAVKELLGGWLREQPDLTEAELRERLAGTGVQTSKSRVGQVLRQMGLRRKKSRSMRLNATPKPTSSGAKSTSPRSPLSRRRA
jgi:transposase